MRKHLGLLLLLLASILTFTGCSKDNDDKVSIEGTWKGKKAVVTYYVNGVKDESGENGGTTEYADGEATLKLSGGKFSIEGDESNNESGTYTYTGNTLTLKYNSTGDEDVTTVRELTQTSLILVNEFTEENEGKTYRIVTESYFTR